MSAVQLCRCCRVWRHRLFPSAAAREELAWLDGKGSPWPQSLLWVLCRQKPQNCVAGIFCVAKCFCGASYLSSGQAITSQVVTEWCLQGIQSDSPNPPCGPAWSLQGMQVPLLLVALNQAQTSPTNSIIGSRLGGVPQLPCGISHTPSQAAQEEMRPEKKGCFHPYLGIPATKRETKPRTWLKLCSQRRNHLIYTKFSLKVGLEEVCPAMGSNFTALSRGANRGVRSGGNSEEE